MAGGRLPLTSTPGGCSRARTAGGSLSIPGNDLAVSETPVVNGRDIWGFFHSWPLTLTTSGRTARPHGLRLPLRRGQRGTATLRRPDGRSDSPDLKAAALRALPYAANTTGGFDWVKMDRGSPSAAAWYIFAKNPSTPSLLTRPRCDR